VTRQAGASDPSNDKAGGDVIADASAVPAASRAAAVLLWIVAVGWGFSAPWLMWWVIVRGRLPVLPIIGEPNGGPFYVSFSRGTFVVLLGASLLLAVAQWWAASLLWAGQRSGALLELALLPVEAVFWYGFALPIPPLLAVAEWFSLPWHGRIWSKGDFDDCGEPVAESFG
jgi:hypothetical protein